MTKIAKTWCLIGLIAAVCTGFLLAIFTQQPTLQETVQTQDITPSVEHEQGKKHLPFLRLNPPAHLLDDAVLTQPDDANKPVFDRYTVVERKARKLPLTLPEIPPFYGEKVVYLTLDDGPYVHTDIILDILKEQHVPATFFVLGVQVEKYPAILKRIYEEGHAIGNHTYNHAYREVYKSPADYLNQLQRTDELIQKIIGVRPRITRAPGGTVGHFNQKYWQAIKDNGYVDIGWNINADDASKATASQIIANVCYQMGNRALWNRAIILLHDGPSQTETFKALPVIIQYLKKEGFQFRVVDLRTPPAW
ncbi:polysaccharide deacetylase family protein [Acetonema longum]|uniref:Polysaccharide deacetylase n=1 Tax=Acetonema longum DSM 6540 TaxID=1009370 RepID=F7NPC2_9FIRM|nr:polysaccharide deacetylase family protein [Acetonema longum]EGO62084.1 polysaccharide deacetylase [Acetonema longum DSM 6540]